MIAPDTSKTLILYLASRGNNWPVRQDILLPNNPIQLFLAEIDLRLLVVGVEVAREVGGQDRYLAGHTDQQLKAAVDKKTPRRQGPLSHIIELTVIIRPLKYIYYTWHSPQGGQEGLRTS